ncbi:hypothetical protein BC835DRAFT_1384301 [Cytidiella melzeri]|nr:hypothetical protein BC835DRAFT_1384301 [Cytidiella melzeri]
MASIPGVPSEIQVATLLKSTDALLATKYLAGSALVLSLWDTVVTIDQEAAYMWPREWDLTQIVFFLNRYGISCCLIYVNYMLGGMRPTINEVSCKVFVLVLCILTVLYSMSANAYVTLRHYSLWDHRRGIMIALGIALFVTYIPVFVLGGMSIGTYYRHTYYVAILDTCLVSTQPDTVKGFWGCMVAFDVFVIILTACSALDRPRRNQHELITNMRRDGALSFFALFFMRLLNFMLNVFLPPEEIFIAVFLTWALISITISHMILRIEALKTTNNRRRSVGQKGEYRNWVPTLNAFELNGY